MVMADTASPAQLGPEPLAPRRPGAVRLTTVDAHLAVKLRNLFVDHVTTEVTARFASRQIDSILLKGAAFARLFYDHDHERAYTDSDLLVRTGDVAGAEQALAELGFVRIDRDEDWLGPDPKYAHTFRRARDGALVDLHWRISGVAVAPEPAWSELYGRLTRLDIGGLTVATLDTAASAMLLALHGAHHGTGRAATLSEIERAVQRLDFETWQRAMALAHQLGAGDHFAAGLRLTAAGDALGDRLGLSRPATVELWLKNHSTSYGAWVLDRFTQTKSVRGRLRICLQVAAPPPVVMRSSFALARRGRGGLALAYLLRPLRLVAQAGPAVRVWRRARRHTRAARG